MYNFFPRAMYPFLLILHSWTRWLVLISLIYTTYHAFRSWWTDRSPRIWNTRLMDFTLLIAYLQMVLGLCLYSLSPFVAAFWQQLPQSLHLREVRFFGIEHSVSMLVAVALMRIGTYRAKRQKPDAQRFKTIFLWFGVALLLLLSSIPWGLPPLVNRPFFR